MNKKAFVDEDLRGITVADTGEAQKPRRPRDELGRPLPRHAPNRLPLEDFDRLDIAENNRLALAYFAAAQYFGAHEAWESCWKQAIGAPDAEGFKGLAQLAAGYVHLQRGNPHGCGVLLRRAIGRLVDYQPGWHGIDVPRLIACAEEVIEASAHP
jgi:uncharacterized protein